MAFFISIILVLGVTGGSSGRAFGVEPGVKASAPEVQAGQVLSLTQGLAVGPLGRYGRSAIHSDPIEYQLVLGTLETPREGLKVGKSEKGGDLAWEAIQAGEDGWFKSNALRGGTLYVPVPSPETKVMILEASGHSSVLVNGAPRGGDVYAYGWIQHPVQVQEGNNHFFFYVSRGQVKAKLVEPEKRIFLGQRDMILPDLILGEDESLWAAIRVINATGEALKDLLIQCQVEEGEPLATPVPVVTSMTSRKVGFRIRGSPPESEGKLKARIVLSRQEREKREELDSLSFEIEARAPQNRHTRTFISSIDGSVQYYCLSPGRIEGDQKPALFLSLHGAAVWAPNQAACYAPKSWGHVVVPTNRRPYGFDWEDWGRIDAMEVLALAQERFRTDPRRTYLTGHSMGGHGVWYLGAVYPGRFAAIGPSAGWYSFWSYGGKERDRDATPIEELFSRASNSSDTLGLSRNYLHHGIYILHGEKDDNVPVTQSRFMREHLGKFHGDFAYYERPGAGHWWGGECCDWPPMFDFFKCHTLPDPREKGTVEFTTCNPGISSRSHWVSIEAQEQHLKFSSVHITQDVHARRFSGTTENVALLALDLDQLDPGEAVTVELDGQKLEAIPTPAGTRTLWLSRKDHQWGRREGPNPDWKGSRRYGTFKDAFRNRVLFVYSTQGTPEENEWSYNKARYDAETFWYRGNGSIDIIADKEFDPSAEADRNVILYGSADTNAAWDALLRRSPVQVRRGKITIGQRTLAGGDLGCYFVRPRPESFTASIGVVAGTGLVGMKAANANQYFIAGSGFPDLIVFGADMLQEHFSGVRAVGYFGIDWSVERGEFGWRDGPAR